MLVDVDDDIVRVESVGDMAVLNIGVHKEDLAVGDLGVR
tara:strand:+ start:120 stop:236 length:117 start_codon:yes stop_codon:yes gene_type:complete